MTDARPMRFFFYGTLRDADVRAAVVGRATAARLLLREARLAGYRAVYAAGQRYPVLVPCHGAEAPGVLVDGVDALALRRLCDFETHYDLVSMTVEADAARVPAQVFMAGEPLRATAAPFDFAEWQMRYKPEYLKARARVG